MTLLENEVIEDLQLNGIKIIQKKNGFKFGTDAVLLSDFSKDIHSQKTLDLCSGSGIIPLLLTQKTRTKKIVALEIQKEMCKMAARSVEMNNLSDTIEVVNLDLNNSVELFGKRQFDLITCNPPYMKKDSALLNEDDSKIIARHEVLCTLEDIIRVSSMLLDTTGHLAMVHKPQRFCEMTYLMQKYNLAPKRIRFVQKTAKESPELVLCDALYGAKSDVKILPPLIMYDDAGNETSEMKKIYGRI